MSEFTSGKWFAQKDKGLYRIVNGEHVLVADKVWDYDANLIAAAPEMFAELEKWAAIDCDQYPQPPCCQADCLTCSARALHARIVQFGPHAHAGVWISRETADRISKDGA